MWSSAQWGNVTPPGNFCREDITVFAVSTVLQWVFWNIHIDIFSESANTVWLFLFWSRKNRWEVLLCCSSMPVSTWARCHKCRGMRWLDKGNESAPPPPFFKEVMAFVSLCQEFKQSGCDKFQWRWRRWSSCRYFAILRGNKLKNLYVVTAGCIWGWMMCLYFLPLSRNKAKISTEFPSFL